MYFDFTFQQAPQQSPCMQALKRMCGKDGTTRQRGPRQALPGKRSVPPSGSRAAEGNAAFRLKDYKSGSSEQSHPLPGGSSPHITHQRAPQRQHLLSGVTGGGGRGVLGWYAAGAIPGGSAQQAQDPQSSCLWERT